MDTVMMIQTLKAALMMEVIAVGPMSIPSTVPHVNVWMEVSEYLLSFYQLVWVLKSKILGQKSTYTFTVICELNWFVKNWASLYHLDG